MRRPVRYGQPMSKSKSRSPELFPNGWCVRRDDGTIATIQGVSGLGLLAARALAMTRSQSMNLGGVATIRRQCSLDRVPKASMSTKTRAGAPVYLSFKLCLVSLGTGKARQFRWTSAGVGPLDQLNQHKIDTAWRHVYSQWAWATAMKQQHRPTEVMAMSIPADLDQYLEQIVLPPAPTTEQVLRQIAGT